MPAFTVNLIRDRVVSAKRRRLLFCGVILYIGLAGIALILMAHRAASSIVDANRSRARMDLINRRFREGHPGRRDIMVYARELARDLEQCDSRLTAVNGVLQRRLDLGAILYHVLSPLPSDARLVGLHLDGEKRVLGFDLAVPATEQEPATDAGKLVATWNGNRELRRHVSGLRAVMTQRQAFRGESVYVLRFACDVLQGES